MGVTVPTRFRGVEGLRAWLAWTVVASHIFVMSGLCAVLPWTEVIVSASAWAVYVFIIVSGFVITNLLLENNERYPVYIARRGLRLYPAYIVCLILDLIVTRHGYAAFLSNPWGGKIHATAWYASVVDIYSAELQNLDGPHFSLYLFSHLLLLHGVIPDSVLNYSAITILNPAWSLTLEWQFYLIAPIVLALCRRGQLAIVMVIAAGAYLAFSRGYVGLYRWPSVLPLAAPYFLIGIATRFLFQRLPSLRTYPLVSLAATSVLAIAILGTFLVPVAVWVAAVAYMKCDKPPRWLRTALDSKWANAAGGRSYAVYVLHWVVVSGLLYALVRLGAGPRTLVVLLALGTIAVTIIGSELLHRYVERPCIRFGKRLNEWPEAAARDAEMAAPESAGG